MNISKIFNVQKSKLFWLYIAFGFIFMAIAIMLAPFWLDISSDIFFASWGRDVIKFIIAGLIILYVATFLIKKIVKGTGGGVIRVLVIVETFLLILIALGAVLSQFNVLKINNAGQIIGLALWLRGSIEVFRAYYYNDTKAVTASSDYKYPVWWLAISIAFITIGTFMLVTNFLSNETVLWIVVAVIFTIGLLLLVLGFIKNPKRAKTLTKTTAKTQSKLNESNNGDK